MSIQSVERWRTAHVGEHGDRVKIGGIRIWQQEWRWIDKRTVRLPHPLNTNEVFSFMICEVGTSHAPVRFAAAEIEPDIWAFYVPD